MPSGGGTDQPASGGNASYRPTAQPEFDALYQQILKGFPQTAGETPAGAAYPQALDYFKAFLDPYNAVGPAGAGFNTAFDTAMQGAYRAPQAFNAGDLLYRMGVDPQQALYNRTLNQVQQQAGLAAANSGVTGTPYAAGATSDALRNFNIDWQNQQLQRAIAGSQAGLGQWQGGVALGQGPQNVANQTFSNILQSLGNITNLGNQQYVLPQQALNDLQSYLQLGQAGDALSAQLGNLGLQQQQNALSGVGNLVGFGNNLLGNPLGSIASSVGSGLGLGSAGLGAFDAGAGLGAFGASAATQGAADAGIFSGLSQAAPFALS